MTSTSNSLPSGAEFAFGESPFKAKGSLYLGTQKFFKKKVPGAKSVDVRFLPSEPMEAKAGVPRLHLTYRVNWT